MFKSQRRYCVLSLSKDINPSFVLVQHKKAHPFLTERLLMRHKESNQTNKTIIYSTMLSSELQDLQSSAGQG